MHIFSVTNDLFATEAKTIMSGWNLRTGYHKFSLSETYPERGTVSINFLIIHESFINLKV